jgi:hypothetical protein
MNLEGGCACGALRYKLTADPLIVHACRCRDCQRLTGGAFVTNIWIERKFVEAKSFKLTAGSGKPQEVFFCDRCGTYLWSKYYASPGDTLWFASGRLIIRKQSSRMFTSSRGANCHGLICQKMLQHSNRFMTSTLFGQYRAKSGSAVT